MPKPLPTRRHTLSVLVDNEFGVLSRIIQQFSGRGYNIDSLTVSEVDKEKKLSRITIVTTCSDVVIDQIKKLLDRTVPVHEVVDLTMSGPFVEREMAFIKVVGTGVNRVEALRIADVFRARVVDATTTSFVFEITGAPEKVDSLVELMRPIGLAEVVKTGVIAVSRGEKALHGRVEG